MPKKLKLALIVGIPTAFALTFYWKVITSEVALFELYPNVAERHVIWAHRQMLRDILTFKLDARGYTDDDWQRTFEEYLGPFIR